MEPALAVGHAHNHDWVPDLGQLVGGVNMEHEGARIAIRLTQELLRADAHDEWIAVTTIPDNGPLRRFAT
jgi:hypothetical protein